MNKSVITNMAKTTEAIPLVVKKARFTFFKSFGFTNVC
jgi:hypothetical protein